MRAPTGLLHHDIVFHGIVCDGIVFDGIIEGSFLCDRPTPASLPPPS